MYLAPGAAVFHVPQNALEIRHVCRHAPHLAHTLINLFQLAGNGLKGGRQGIREGFGKIFVHGLAQFGEAFFVFCLNFRQTTVHGGAHSLQIPPRVGGNLGNGGQRDLVQVFELAENFLPGETLGFFVHAAQRAHLLSESGCIRRLSQEKDDEQHKNRKPQDKSNQQNRIHSISSVVCVGFIIASSPRELKCVL